jgi:small subunit ribosomal protein S7
MPRKQAPSKREVLPDAKYRSKEVAKFINVVMRSGKKSVAEKIIYGALTQIEAKAKKDPVETLTAAIENVRPLVEVKSRRVGGANYQVPIEVRADRSVALAMRWLRNAMRSGSAKSTALRLATELMDASEGRGSAMKKREDIHRMAMANKAFSHFRF